MLAHPVMTSTHGMMASKLNRHTLLQARDIPKFLGLTVFYNPNDVYNIPIYFRPPQLPRPLKELASKDALINWLTSLLFAIISDRSLIAILETHPHVEYSGDMPCVYACTLGNLDNCVSLYATSAGLLQVALSWTTAGDQSDLM